MTATIEPSEATDKSVTWSSSDETKATVDVNGKISAISSGETIITVTTVEGGKTATCQLTVNDPIVGETGVSLDKTEVTLEVGQDVTLSATVLPENATDKTVTFTSSAEGIATVTPKQGKVTAIAPGSAKVIATTVNGLTAECNVTVSEPTPPPEETK